MSNTKNDVAELTTDEELKNFLSDGNVVIGNYNSLVFFLNGILNFILSFCYPSHINYPLSNSHLAHTSPFFALILILCPTCKTTMPHGASLVNSYTLYLSNWHLNTQILNLEE